VNSEYSSHLWTEHQQQKFCVQLLLDGMCKWAKFQLKFWLHHLDHSTHHLRTTDKIEVYT
jgi:hypothetical protein